MSRTRIAPTLHRLVYGNQYSDAIDVAAARELTAMEAAIRAAERWRAAQFAYSMAPPERRETTPLIKAENAAGRALARLRRVSGGARTTKGAGR